MYKNIITSSTFILILGCNLVSAEEQQPEAVDVTENYFGYGSVESAIDKLSSAPGAQIRKTDDRTVISIESEYVKWEFPAKSQPYYPSIIKSQVLMTDAGLDYKVQIACYAEADRCEEMSRSYAKHVNAVKNQFSKQR